MSFGIGLPTLGDLELHVDRDATEETLLFHRPKRFSRQKLSGDFAVFRLEVARQGKHVVESDGIPGHRERLTERLEHRCGDRQLNELEPGNFLALACIQRALVGVAVAPTHLGGPCGAV